jgi:glycosyltransferase involved in cell wall biosynthesis
MKLLIITQVIDSEHPILGFFHRWVEEFATHCEQVHVICLQAGKQSLPANVTVHSLGKEEGKGRLVYLFRFYKLIWQLRHEYDHVFVHMNQIYVILGAPFWRAARKKVGLWYMHGAVPFSLRVAEKMSNKIFTGTLDSFKLQSKKVSVTGHGIDTERFTPTIVSKDSDLITVGRITESKNLIALVNLLKEVRKTHFITLTIIGSAVSENERRYESVLKAVINRYGLSDAVNFFGPVSQKDLPAELNKAKIFVTAAQNGSLDKAVLEAMACGVSIISMAPGTTSLPFGHAQVNNLNEFSSQINSVLESKMFMREEYSVFIQRNHSLQSLIPRIVQSFYEI